MKSLLFIANADWFFISHRLPVAKAARDKGYDVHVATATTTLTNQSLLIAEGMTVHELPLTRSSGNPLRLIREFRAIFRLLRVLQPDITHLIALKPILLGGMAARLIGRRNVIFAVPGRGYVFVAQGLGAFARRVIVKCGYRMAYSRGFTKVIVQNVEDQGFFVRNGIFRSEDICLIRGSGVELDVFRATPEPASEPVVVLASRMLREKGIEDFVAAARILSSRRIQARYVLIGDVDPGNPHSLSRAEMTELASDGVVEWVGFCSDMPRVLSESHIFCLPTYYGEGVPKVLIEAAATGRPIITTDIPGCRDIVRNNENGILVQPRDVPALAVALAKLIGDMELRKKMGAAGRKLVEQQFGLNAVVNQTLDIYESFDA